MNGSREGNRFNPYFYLRIPGRENDEKMIEFGQSEIIKATVHFVGNKMNQANLVLSSKPFKLRELGLEDKVKDQFFKPLHKEQMFRFGPAPERGYSSREALGRLFEDPSKFMEESYAMAKHLYECSNHTKIRDGHFFMFYLKNVFFEESVVDAIALFKMESLEDFIVVESLEDIPEVMLKEGYPIGKIDKACVIFNTEAEDGYRAVLVDAINKIQEAHYWRRDFLAMEQMDEGYVPTVRYMEMVKSFSQDFLIQENDIPKESQLQFLKKSEDFFAKKDIFDVDEFTQEVIIEPQLSDAFLDYKEEFEQEKQMPTMDRFQISSKAVQKNANKFFRSVIKLDKNFHVYVHGNSDFIERSFDEERGLNYYKLYFREES